MNMRTRPPMASKQSDLFSPANLASAVSIPKAPTLIPHEWPYPGMSGEDCARSCLANSAEFAKVIALTILHTNQELITAAEVKALLPQDWKDLLGRWTHASLAAWQGEQYGIRVEYVSHGADAGFHWQYRLTGLGGEA